MWNIRLIPKHAAAFATALGGAASAGAAGNVTVIFSETFETPPTQWTILNMYYGGWNSVYGNPGGCFFLNNAGELAHDPTIQRVVGNLEPQHRYELSGDFKGFTSNCPQPIAVSFKVDIDGETVFASARVTEWSTFTYSWIAHSEQITISVRAETDGTDCDYIVDNITLSEIAPPCMGDITDNGVVDGTDLAALLGAWGTSGQGEFVTDRNSDGIVDGEDLAFVLGGWGPCPRY